MDRLLMRHQQAMYNQYLAQIQAAQQQNHGFLNGMFGMLTGRIYDSCMMPEKSVEEFYRSRTPPDTPPVKLQKWMEVLQEDVDRWLQDAIPII